MTLAGEIEFLPLGGAYEVGASSFYLRTGEMGILLDCGINPKKGAKSFLPRFDLLKGKPLDFVFISHAHQDHIGGLPFLVKMFPHVQIYSTKATKDIAALVLHNSLNLLKKGMLETTGHALFSHEEIDMLVSSIHDYEYGEQIMLKSFADTKTEAKGEFIDAGHVLGSASIYIELGGKNMLESGDGNLAPEAILDGGALCRMKADHLLMESTYGASENSIIPSWDTEAANFSSALNKVLNAGGSVLIPVFALGKFQEIISLLSELMDKGKVLRTDIYTHGLGKSISRIYDRYLYLVRRNLPALKLRDIPQIDLTELGNLMHLKTHPGIVLASSGMLLKNTISYDLAKFFLRIKDFAIFSVGYMDPETPGFGIMNNKQGSTIVLGSEKITVKCNIAKFTFRSHSINSELEELVRLTNPEFVHLIHGEEAAIAKLGGEIIKRFPHIKLTAPELGISEILK